MKSNKLLCTYSLSFLCCLLFSFTALNSNGQSCGNSGPSICTPNTGGATVAGFYPDDTALPCATDGIAYSEVISFFAPDSAAGFPLQSIVLSSISNLPCGLCWASNSTTNTFAANSAGCFKVSGTTKDAAGEFKVIAYGSAVVILFGNPVSVGPLNIDSALGLSYYIRVSEKGETCAPIDTNSPGLTAATAGSCAKPTFSKTIANCATTEKAVGTYYGYAWSNGTYGSSITVAPTVSTKYTVTVFDNCASATAAVTVAPIAAETVTITPTVGAKSVKLKATAAASTYLWSTGATTATITVKTKETYTVTATKTATGCTATASYDVTTLEPVRNDEADKTDNTTATETPASITNGTFEATVYPNPYGSVFHVHAVSSSTANMNITVFDVNGKQVEARENVAYGSDVVLGDSYAAGTYIVQVKQGETTKSLKIVKTNN